MRIGYIDIAKSLALICVIWSHSVGSEYASISYGFMIPSFFLLSGVTLKKLSLQQKAKRLLTPYVIFNILILLIASISGMRQVTLTNWIGVLYSRFSLYPLSEPNNVVFMNVGNSPTWFLTAMFMSFVFLKGILLIKKGNVQFLICGFYILLTLLMSKLKILLPWSIDSAMLFAVFMYTGTQLKNFFQKEIFLSMKVFLIGCCIYITGWYLNKYINLSIRDYGYSILLVLINGVIGTLLLIRFSIIIEKTLIGKLLTKLNKGAITLFCIQMPLLIVAAKIAPAILPHNTVFITIFQVIFTLSIGFYIAKVISPLLNKVTG